MDIKFNTIEEAIEDIKAGKMIIVVDDENRENGRAVVWFVCQWRRKGWMS